MHATVTYDKPAVAVAFAIGIVFAAFVGVFAGSMYVAHQQGTLTPPVVPQTTVQTDVCPIGDDWSCALR